ncbi:MAG TPA: ATP-dependent zinc metalloprotease FtsH, partial [Ktedonobacteraceae bacterium]|nr:ATP-dependent zinc metalloprotease FtsH [Ktedonobacteraceae bacterium]
EGYGRRPKQPKNYGRQFWKVLQTHKSAFLTSFMLLLIIVLLFSVASQLQPPVINSSPNGVTVIDYSTFISQVKAGNVEAVTIRGEEINGLLANPMAQNGASAPKVAANQGTQAASKMTSADYTAWQRYINAANPGIANLAGSTSLNPDRVIYTLVPGGQDASLVPLLLSSHVVVSTQPPAQSTLWITLLWRFAPIILLVVALLIFLATRNNTRMGRSMNDQMNQLGKSRARRFEPVKEKEASPLPADRKTTALTPKTGSPGKSVIRSSVTFADVAGIDEVRTELEEIVQFLRTPERFSRLGARIPRGALLVGPPGTGKTLLARAVAGEAGVPFFSMSASEFVEMFVGVGASRVRDLFNQARSVAPSVVFIDEIDAVGRKRSMRVGGNDERDQTLNQLLVELDGFDPRKAVVVLAATNRADILDKALLRPGRFDRRITVSLPDRVGREAILQVHTRSTPLHEEVSLARLARITTGMSGADLANLVNEAALSAARQDLERITHACFEDALARVQLGALRPIVMNEKERRIIAIHEGGHALVAHHLSEADTVNRVTILPRGQSLGVTQFTAEEDRYNYSRQTLMARIAVGLGGRVAEELTFGPDYITTGAENDLQVVTDLARRMVTRWGMSEEIGVVFADYQAEGDASLNMKRFDPAAFSAQARSLAVDTNGQLVMNGQFTPHQTLSMAISAPRNTSGVMMNALIDAEVRRILREGQAMARALLTEHNDQLLLLADTLMECEQLDRAQFEALLQS